MEESLFINHHVVNTKKSSSVNEFQLVISLFDKKGKEIEFSSTYMNKEMFDLYEKSVLKTLNSKNWLQVVHNEPIHTIKPVLDIASKKVVGLQTNTGLILKNIVKFY
ncbi:MAG: hypothetical protein IJD48_02745 [Clostridia bacterium]|nr:hypothetical protein [Clostridia bacterium]